MISQFLQENVAGIGVKDDVLHTLLWHWGQHGSSVVLYILLAVLADGIMFANFHLPGTSLVNQDCWLMIKIGSFIGSSGLWCFTQLPIPNFQLWQLFILRKRGAGRTRFCDLQGWCSLSHSLLFYTANLSSVFLSILFCALYFILFLLGTNHACLALSWCYPSPSMCWLCPI